MRSGVLLGLVLLQACAGAPGRWAPVARPSLASCGAPGAPATEGWQLVSTPGFTFCVPADWRASGERTWQGGSGSITWGVGAPPIRQVVTGDVITRVPVGAAASDASIQQAVESAVRERCRLNRLFDVVGGVRVELHQNVCDGRHYTGARWRSPAAYFQGQAEDAGTASVQLLVFRTMRFRE